MCQSLYFVLIFINLMFHQYNNNVGKTSGTRRNWVIFFHHRMMIAQMGFNLVYSTVPGKADFRVIIAGIANERLRKDKNQFRNLLSRKGTIWRLGSME